MNMNVIAHVFLAVYACYVALFPSKYLNYHQKKEKVW